MRGEFPQFGLIDPTTRLLCAAEGDAGSPPPSGGTPPPPPPAGATGAAPGATGEPSTLPPQPADEGWTREALEKQVGRMHRKIKEHEAQASRYAEMEAENARLRQLAEAAVARRTDPPSPPSTTFSPPPPPPSAPTPPPPSTPTPPNADAVLAQARFQVRLELLEKDLGARYKEEWRAGWDNLQRAAEATAGQNARSVIEAIATDVMDTDDPAYVLTELCKDPTRLQDAIDMTPGQRRNVMARIAFTKTADAGGGKSLPKPSGAPPPPTGEHQRGGSGEAPIGNNLYDSRYDFANYFEGNRVAPDKEIAVDEEWYAERRRQKLASTGRVWSIGGKAGPGRPAV